jgi:hypothetical protein
MKWNVGIAEYWNIGFPTTVPMFQYSNFSIFQSKAGDSAHPWTTLLRTIGI